MALKLTSEKRVLTVSYRIEVTGISLQAILQHFRRTYLAIVESTINSNTVYVFVGDSSHLLLLNRRHSAVGVQNVDGDVLLSPQTINGGTMYKSSDQL